jgi:predicted O-methyltransferase YrrM
MSSRTLGMSDRLHDYLMASALRDPPILPALRQATEPLEFGGMQISPEQGQLMMLLIELIGASRYLEIGTFTGYSALCAALALPADGRVTALDRNKEWTDIGRRHWREAGVEHKIDLRLGDGGQSLDALIQAGEAGRFDLAFIDADKMNYDKYYERCLVLVRQGGLIALDNMLWSGAVADPEKQDEDTVAIRALNSKIRDDARVTASLVPIGDGLMLCRRRF